jgi:predicted CXXCH cytochrome family protein
MLAGIGLWAVRAWRRPTPSPRPQDPRLLYAGPFQNIHPDVPYVSDDKCSGCHREIALSYAQHPMGRSLVPISQFAGPQRYDAKAHNPFEALGTLLRVERQGERMVHRQIGLDEKGQSVYELDMPIDYVLGSGTRGHSYLIDRDGYVFQTPISWYSQKQIWDESPGFGVEVRSGRPVAGECLFCHANRTRPREGYLNRFEEPVFDGHAIGCQRCHGPGGRHIEDPGREDSATGADSTIVNPHHLDPALRSAVCEQCHLAGASRVARRGRGLYDFRPGLPLEAFWSVFVPATEPGEERKAVGHVEQMYLSQCFQRSEERPAQGQRKLSCTSCHDPHRSVEPDQRVTYYRQRCLACHDTRPCTEPKTARLLRQPDDSCIACHMPRYATANIAHTAVTEHRIVRHADKLPPGEIRRPKRRLRLVPFHREGRDPNDPELERDLGIALVQMFAEHKATPEGTGGTALRLLEAAVRNDPEDLDARESEALLLTFLQRPAESLAAYEAVLSQAPHREAALTSAAQLAQEPQQFEAALSYWRRAVADNPHQADYRASLAQLLVRQKAWDEARPHCEAWLRLDPANIEARALWVRCLLQTGDRTQAQAEFAKIQRLRPSNLPLLEARFAVEFRSR